ncbi:AAA family ATPase [Polynucleobacter sinensis]|uniref:AAA family ATPase n=1 Tax=Polynucleobacter sinensis TaxID=1743157 RepID=UPI0007864B32
MSNTEPRSILEKFYEQQTTDAMMKNIQDTGYCYLRLIPMSHLIMICAPGNTGKTAFAIHASAEMVRAGFEVMYINADASAPDLKFYHNHAMANGYRLIAPDLNNLSSEGVVKILEEMAKSNEDFNYLVIVIDTIKKFVDVIGKNKVKGFLKTLRALTAKGVTVICLGHTNKHQDNAGKLVFEGTGDIRNDVDELYYLVSEKIDGGLRVSTDMDKCRAEVKDITFTINGKDRIIQIIPYEDIKLKKALSDQLAKDQPMINFIKKSLMIKERSPTELEAVAKTMGNGFTRRNIDKVLRAYSSGDAPLWIATKAPKNGLIYSLISAEASAHLQSCEV